MNGNIGGYLKAAADGNPTAKKHLRGVFQGGFEDLQGWRTMLANIPGGDVDILLNRTGGFWTRECFQALYVACWIFHPVEKGTYMLKLGPAHYPNVRAAYDGLLASGALQSRISSHLSGQGASAHEGWAFLRGYGELLLQLEGGATEPYLMLKCEGHALESGLSLSTVLHGASYVKKKLTGSGATANDDLHQLAQNSLSVEGRAAENYSKSYERVLDKLGLKGKMITVEDVLSELLKKAGFNGRLPNQLKRNTHELGRAMKGPQGYLQVLRMNAATMKKNGVKFDDKLIAELDSLADRMIATAVAHPCQYFNEIRVTATELNAALATFRGHIH